MRPGTNLVSSLRLFSYTASKSAVIEKAAFKIDLHYEVTKPIQAKIKDN